MPLLAFKPLERQAAWLDEVGVEPNKAPDAFLTGGFFWNFFSFSFLTPLSYVRKTQSGRLVCIPLSIRRYRNTVTLDV